MIGQGYVFKKVGDKLFDQDTAKIVRRHAFWGGLIMALPLEVFDTICFVIILWHMYSKLCERANTKLNFGNIVVGFIVNIIVAAVISLAAVAIPIIGWLGTGFVVYLQFYMSGKSYISTLKNVMGYNYPDTPAITNNSSPKSSVMQTYNQPALTPPTHNAAPTVYNPPVQNAQPNNNLLTCPECGQMVSRRADSCPNCGCPISEINQLNRE